MKVSVYDVNGNKVDEIELPKHFEEPVRIDLIRRAVISILTARLQPKGVDPQAGKRRIIERSGKGLGRSRAPRGSAAGVKLVGVFAPFARGGRRAHPPKVEAVLYEDINKKEKRMAIRSAIAATAIKELVEKRGHLISSVPSIPLVVRGIEDINKTKDAREMFKALGLWEDLEKSKNSKRKRAGKGKMRGRRYKIRKSVLVVYGGDTKQPYLAMRNFPGVDVVHVRNLNAYLLAPGAHPGRLTLWSEEAIKELKEKNLFY